MTACRVAQKTLPGFYERLIETSVELVRHYAPKDGTPYWGGFSGGKDSVVIKKIAEMAGVPVEWHYSVTTIDPPELVKFIREYHPDVIFDRPEKPFFALARSRALYPTRRMRWCCEALKEQKSPKGRRLILGIRADESRRRSAKWKLFIRNWKTDEYILSPILHWRNDDVWRFIDEHDLPYCKLYDEGFKRLGCVGCPISSNRKIEFARWPNFEKAWKSMFHYVWKSGRDAGRFSKFSTWEDLWDWWLNDKPLAKDDTCAGQIMLW